MSALPYSRSRTAIDGLAVVLMVSLTFSWGLNGVAAKVTNTGYSPVFLMVVRSALGAALVFLWAIWRGIPLFRRDGTLISGLVVGLLFAGEFLLIFVGLDYTSVARSSLLVNTMPFWTMLAGHFFLGERITGRKVTGLLLAFAGLILIFSDRLSQPGPDALWGDLLSVAAGILWAATIILIRRSRLQTVSAEKLLLYQLVVSAIFAALLLPVSGPWLRDGNLLATAALLFQGIYIVAITYVLWFWLIQHYPVSGLTSFTFLTPVFGVLLGGLLLGEPLGVTIFLALGVIVAGLILVNRAPAR